MRKGWAAKIVACLFVVLVYIVIVFGMVHACLLQLAHVSPCSWDAVFITVAFAAFVVAATFVVLVALAVILAAPE